VARPHRVRPEAIQQLARNLLDGIESRGRDATGYAYVSLRDGCVYLAKAPVNATEFLKLDGHILTRKGVKRMPRGMILHTRAATQGSPADNKNNHPIYSKASGLCMIHNGWISNDDDLVTTHKLKQDAEVDSEVYLKLIEKSYLKHPNKPVEDSIKLATSQVFGSIACAMIQGGRADTMWLWRDSGQLAVISTDWGWVFASTKNAALGALINASSSFDTPQFELIIPAQGSLFTLTSSGKLSVKTVHGGDWNKMPGHISGRVTRTYINGKLTVSRSRRSGYLGNSSNQYTGFYGEYDDYSFADAEVEWFEAQRKRQKAIDDARRDEIRDKHSKASYSSSPGPFLLPDFSRGRTPAANTGTQNGTDRGRYPEDTPPLTQAERREKWHEWGKNKPESCYCRIDYVCLRCGARNEYYGKPLAVITGGVQETYAKE